MTQGLASFVVEDAAVLHAGLLSAPYIPVNDTGARHARSTMCRDGRVAREPCSG
ncbi:hypothetical protein [Ensifer sp. ENS03]|uniref:hypothetical protein n=1 Tax=Ensifer sp. ENS03 TaxID=2769283 RepID=UPI001FEEF2CB|nr:hypothetical protein [Ensifer sp. ENS03]